MNVLVNALGVQNSGGVTVFEKILDELKSDINRYYVICGCYKNIINIIDNYGSGSGSGISEFIVVDIKNIFHRLYFENITFRDIVSNYKIDLIYNFSGSSQFFFSTPQLTKVQNLLFYSKKTDAAYLSCGKWLLWMRQVYLRRVVFRAMIDNSDYLEVQSPHVKKSLSEFLDVSGKNFYVKSDVDISPSIFRHPRLYDFSKTINILYVIGPHFDYVHKNIVDFTRAMLGLKSNDVDFEINITLSKSQLAGSGLWDNSLNDRTNFLGYISDQKKLKELFCDNTIMISTSIVETLGLHVIEGIQNGVIVIVPNEEYSRVVYGDGVITYELFDADSLLSVLCDITSSRCNFQNYIIGLQNFIKYSESIKHDSIVEIISEVHDACR